MDRRIALFVFVVLLLFACDDSNSYDPCASEGCSKKERTASWHTEHTVNGTVTVDGRGFRDGEIRATVAGFYAERYEAIPNDAAADAGDDDAGASTDADADADPDGGDAAPEEQLQTHESAGWTTVRVRVSFAPPAAPGNYRLEDVRAVATVDGASVDLRGTLEVLAVESEDVSAPGAPVEPPYEMPYGWRMRAASADLTIDLYAESRATWSGYGTTTCR